MKIKTAAVILLSAAIMSACGKPQPKTVSEFTAESRPSAHFIMEAYNEVDDYANSKFTVFSSISSEYGVEYKTLGSDEYAEENVTVNEDMSGYTYFFISRIDAVTGVNDYAGYCRAAEYIFDMLEDSDEAIPAVDTENRIIKVNWEADSFETVYVSITGGGKTITVQENISC